MLTYYARRKEVVHMKHEWKKGSVILDGKFLRHRFCARCGAEAVKYEEKGRWTIIRRPQSACDRR
jgi:hypothetical protein